jgi:flagellar biosynthesis anti-sigma factor FlgM
MKINNVNDVLPPPSPGTPKPNGGAREVAPNAAPASAEVTLSPLSAQVAEGLKGAEPTFDAHRVAEVRRVIEEGNYRPDPVRIAEAVIAQVAFTAKPQVQ